MRELGSSEPHHHSIQHTAYGAYLPLPHSSEVRGMWRIEMPLAVVLFGEPFQFGVIQQI